MTPEEHKELIERSLWLASGQDDPHSVTITELCSALDAYRDEIAGLKKERDAWRSSAAGWQRLADAKAEPHEVLYGINTNQPICAAEAKLAALAPSDQGDVVLPEGTLGMSGNDVTIYYSNLQDADRAFGILEAMLAAASNKEGA